MYPKSAQVDTVILSFFLLSQGKRMLLLVEFSSEPGLEFPRRQGLLHLHLQAALRGAQASCGLASLCSPSMAYLVGPFYVTVNHMIAFSQRPCRGSDELYLVSAAFNLLDRAHEASRLQRISDGFGASKLPSIGSVRSPDWPMKCCEFHKQYT